MLQLALLVLMDELECGSKHPSVSIVQETFITNAQYSFERRVGQNYWKWLVL